MFELSDPPAGAGLTLVEASDDRLVIVIPPGGAGSASLGCFALLWNAITIPVSCVFLLVPNDKWDGGAAPPLIFLIPFMSVFWIVGAGMIIAWVRSRFMQTMLALEPDRLTIQRKLFGRRTTTRTDLTPESVATLYESYRQNDRPVYGVSIKGIDRTEKFASRLSEPAKLWIIQSMNTFLGHDTSSVDEFGNITHESTLPDSCDICGGKLLESQGRRICPDCGKVLTEDTPSTGPTASFSGQKPQNSRSVPIPAMAPNLLPADSLVRIDLEEALHLRVSYKAVPKSLMMVIPVVAMAGFALMWYGFIGVFIATTLVNAEQDIVGTIVMMVFMFPFILAGLVPLGLSLFLLRGRVVVTIDENYVTAALSILGPLRYRRRVSTVSVQRVALGMPGSSRLPGTDQRMRSLTAQTELTCAVVFSTEKDLPLTLSKNPQLNEQVGGLVRFQLEQLGVITTND